MRLIDNGTTPPQRLIDFLKALTPNRDYDEEDTFGLCAILNHKGTWTLEYDELPSMGSFLGVLAFFENEQHWDTLSEVVFNVGTGHEIRYHNIAGMDKRNYHHLAHVVNAVALATEDRYAAFRRLRDKDSLF